MYTLRITSEHARAMLEALDLYMRLSMGQTREIGRAFEGKNGNWEYQRNRGLEELCDELKQVLFPDLSPNAYYGIMSKDTGKTAHLCYEVHNCLRHRVSWSENPLDKGQMPTTWHDTPILFPSGVEPVPECANEDGKQPELEYNGYKLNSQLRDLLGTTDVVESLRIISKWKELVETSVTKTASKG